MKDAEVTEKNAYKMFDKACEQIKNMYMYMCHDDTYYYFKHIITRRYIKIEREGEQKNDV